MFSDLNMVAYAVKSGDTIYQLASQFQTTVEAIIAANPTVNFHTVYPGQVITIPRGSFPQGAAQYGPPYSFGVNQYPAQPAMAVRAPVSIPDDAVPVKEPEKEQEAAESPEQKTEDKTAAQAPEPLAFDVKAMPDPRGCKPRIDLINAFNTLWEQHVFWTRMVIISAAVDSPDLSFTVARLLRNATDMGSVIKIYYGEANAKKFSDLMREHLTIALALVKAAKASDTNAAKDAERRWYANADKIAEFLSGINPHISRENFKLMLYRHLSLTKSEALARLNKDFAKDIFLFDQIEKQALEMSGEMVQAIIKQFPKKF
jgi:hypothetical protein